MMRETGRKLLGICARIRFAADKLSSTGRKPSVIDEAHFPPDGEQGEYELLSPQGKLRVLIPKSGKLRYSAYMGDKQIISESPIGLLIQRGARLGDDVVTGLPCVTDFDGEYFDFDSQSNIRDCHRGYILPVRERSLSLEYRVEFRLWDDGFGFRLLFQKDSSLLIYDELTEFSAPIDSVCRYQTDVKKLQGKTLEQRARYLPNGENFACLVSFELPEEGGYLLISEAGIVDYPGAALRSLGRGRLKAELWDSDCFLLRGGATPWRLVLACRTLNELVNCRIISHAATPPDPLYDNADWIIPGKSAWSYFINEPESRRFDSIKQFNALARQAGFEYNLIDSGWRKWGLSERAAFRKVREIVLDAQQQGVDVWLWQSAMDRIWFPPYTKRFLRRCKKAGVRGVKLDHLESETQFMTGLYRSFALEAAHNELMVIFHNSQKPTGLRRSFPNVMSMEAIRGLQCGCDADDDTILPFTRLVAGNADYAPLCFSVESCRCKASIAHMLAAAVIYQSAFLTVGESPHILLKNEIGPFVCSLPVVWNETVVLPGSLLGQVAVFARRSAQDWYIAAFNGEQGARTLSTPLSFLPRGVCYELELYFDEPGNPLGVNRQVIPVTCEDSIDVILRDSGGYAGRLCAVTDIKEELV